MANSAETSLGSSNRITDEQCIKLPIVLCIVAGIILTFVVLLWIVLKIKSSFLIFEMTEREKEKENKTSEPKKTNV